MKSFDENFRTNLYDTIELIEDNSLVEIVVIIKAQSGKYRDISVWAGIAFAFLLYTFFMFSNYEFGVYLIYVFTILGFFFMYGLVSISSLIKFYLLKKKRMLRNVEISARAIFQKGGIRFTKEKIGVLIYLSLFEKKVYILPDRGAETALPIDEWNNMKKDFQSIFNKPNIADTLIIKLKKWQFVFSKYIPAIENDINELPNNMNVEL